MDLLHKKASARELAVPAIGAASLLSAGAAFQVALALGVPLGEATFGGRATTVSGVLSLEFRVLAAVNGVVLGLFSWVILARSGLTSVPFLSDQVIAWTTWGIVAFLFMNTIGNLTAPHPLERWGMGSVTLFASILGAVVGLRARS